MPGLLYACSYDDEWYFGVANCISVKNYDMNIKFLQPNGPVAQFFRPSLEDTCWIPINDIMTKVDPPSYKSTGRFYCFDCDKMNCLKKLEGCCLVESNQQIYDFYKESSQHQNGVNHSSKYFNGSESSLSRSPVSSSQSTKYLNNEVEHEHRQSPPISAINQRTSASSKWVPPQLLRDITDRNELIFRRVRGILNKLTPENFDKLSYSLLNIGIDNKTILKGIIILIFEKAIAEKQYCNLYAQLCLKLSHEAPNFDTDTNSNTNTFLRLLLSKCQEEFESRYKASTAFDKQETLSQEDQEAKQDAKRKMLGNIKFIGELGKFELVHEAILHKCIQQLLAKKKRVSLVDMGEDIECLCQIMTTVGKRLDKPKAKNIMDQYFDRMTKLSESQELSSRIRFMLQDVLELRAKQWVPRWSQQENGPRSVTQIRWEMTGHIMPPPPFPFLPPGMGPPTKMMENSPFGGNMMNWMGDPLFAGSMITTPHKNVKIEDFVDDTKDIFGKPVQTSVAPKKSSALKMQAKPDLFEPHYMKAKNSGQYKGKVSTTETISKGLKKVTDDEKANSKPINRSNPWNIDPFAPHYSKSAAPSFPVSEEAKKSATPPKADNLPYKYSPPVSRQKSNTGFNKSIKKTDEISLRPTSFMKKKEDKPKSLFAKAEELPPKMQQFTNLTINDKTTSSSKASKKTALNKADIDSKLEELWKSFKEDGVMENMVNGMQSLTTNIKYSKMTAKQYFHFIISKEREDLNELANILAACVSKDVLSTDIIMNAFKLAFDDIKIMEALNGKEFMGSFASQFVTLDWITLSKLMEQFHEGSHFPTALLVFVELQKQKGQVWVQDLIKTSKVDLKLIFPKDSRSDDAITKEVQQKGLSYLFPHLCLKEELMKLMKTEKDALIIKKWIDENIKSSLEKKQYIHIVITCLVTLATQDTLKMCDITQKPEKDLQEKEKELITNMSAILKDDIFNGSNEQLEAVYALQIFCYEKQFPKEMLLRLFIIFYNLEIIEEDIFLKWKEDINDFYPGKGKALFQVNNWLQWLETADEEDENEQDD